LGARRCPGRDIRFNPISSGSGPKRGPKATHAGSVAEAVLAHVVGDKVEKAYRRGDLFDKRRELMEAWAEYCLPPKGEKVIQMKRKASPG
jgi:hypothetical protein